MKISDVITTGVSSGRSAVGWIRWTFLSSGGMQEQRELLCELDTERFVTVDGLSRRWSSVASAEIELW